MDREAKQSALRNNEIIANHLNLIAVKSSRTPLIILVTLSLFFLALAGYSKNSLTRSSGMFEIPTDSSNGEIQNSLIIDENHYFDDRVALVQSVAAKNLTTIFTQTTSTFSRFDGSLIKYTTPTGFSDIKANLEHYGIANELKKNNQIQRLHIRFTKGVPLVIVPHYPDWVSEEEISNPKTRQLLPVEKWTLQAEAMFILGESSKSPTTEFRAKFNFDIISTQLNYTSNSLSIDRMSLWEIVR
ncbi:hypothetical protein ACTFQF_00845 [Aliivibrio fischeri]|uniref:Uncharacterized protein n=1 Tax=Aliivibrio fischeri (strain MJ11) TaxID=388396 RepID=B5EW76_ALIFM|nr:hypothetical protein [Aliivibrio fischeri]ACH64797.1 hypothetical protein VFMJ11_B0133 [Aliivibrio fischeri MJ11]MUK37598.1 hypothetical protein [Aliivibrio fischeri]